MTEHTKIAKLPTGRFVVKFSKRFPDADSYFDTLIGAVLYCHDAGRAVRYYGTHAYVRNSKFASMTLFADESGRVLFRSHEGSNTTVFVTLDEAMSYCSKLDVPFEFIPPAQDHKRVKPIPIAPRPDPGFTHCTRVGAVGVWRNPGERGVRLTRRGLQDSVVVLQSEIEALIETLHDELLQIENEES